MSKRTNSSDESSQSVKEKVPSNVRRSGMGLWDSEVSNQTHVSSRKLRCRKKATKDINLRGGQQAFRMDKDRRVADRCPKTSGKEMFSRIRL